MTNHGALHAIEAIAASQFGVFSERQAIDVGVSADMLRHHSRPGGRWARVAPLVYEVVDQPPDRRRPLMAGLLSCGNDAVLCRRSSGLLLGLDGVEHRVPELLVPDGRRPGQFRVWRGAIAPAELAVTDGLRHTSALRTFTDLCRTLDDVRLEWALESVLRHGLLSLDDIVALASAPAWQGVTRLRRVLALRPPDAPPTGSVLETAFIQLVRSLPVEEPVRQYEVWHNGALLAKLDIAFPFGRVFVEADGTGIHARPEALYRDRSRQNDVVRVLGWLPLRYTAHDILGVPTATARQFLDAYRRNRARMA